MEQNRRKVLIACDSSRSLLDFRGKLIEALLVNNDVFVCTPKITNSTIKSKLTSWGVSVFENDLESSNVSVWSDLKYISSLYRVIKAIQPDVFFPYAFKPVIYGAIVANWCKIKSITPMLTGLGYNFVDTSSKKALVKRITRGLLKLSLSDKVKTRLILQNKDDYNTLLNFGILDSKNKAYIVNGSGVDLSYYDYTVPDTKAVSFLMISRLINAKGIYEYYESARLIREKYPNVKFKLIGPYDNNIDAISNELFDKIKAGNIIEYIGQVTDVRPYIEDSSVIVLPSYYGEGVPRCLLEAMAMGRAIITSNSVGCKETVNPSPRTTNGFLIPIKDIPAFVSKMEYFLTNPDDIIQFGINGRKYADQKFDVNKVNKQMLEVIEAV